MLDERRELVEASGKLLSEAAGIQHRINRMLKIYIELIRRRDALSASADDSADTLRSIETYRRRSDALGVQLNELKAS